MTKKLLFWFFIIAVFGLLGFKILSHEHIFSDWTIKVNPTEETTGLKVRECIKCGEKEERVIAKLIHVHDNDSEITVEPTCISTGILKSVCKTCGFEQEIEIDKDVKGHKYSEWKELLDKQTTTTGTHKRVCELCGDVDEKKHNHEFEIWNTIVKATCVKGGVIESQCEECSFKKQENTPTGEHELTEWDVYDVPTCIKGGKAKRHCIYCDLKEDVELGKDKNGHKYSAWETIIKETLTTEGLRRRYCELCDAVEEEVIPAHEHKMSEWQIIVASTCSKGGTAQRKCDGCGLVETTELKPDEDLHKFGDWIIITKATCDNAGQKKRKCSVCNKEVFEIIPRNEHNYVLDGNTKPGYVLEICALCGHVLAEYVDKPNKD